MNRITGATVIFGLLWLAAPGPLALGVDETYARARQLAQEERRAEARDLCRTILDRSPDYHDVRVLLGRLHAWDGEYGDARRELRRVLSGRSDHLDARNALIDVELWDDVPQTALELAQDGLRLRPDEPSLLYRKTRALKKLNRDDEALDVAEILARSEGEDRPARRLYRGLLERASKNKISADYDLEFFDDNTDNWHGASVAYRRSLPRASIIGRVNFARRFDRTGTQFEIDSYPKIRNKSYLYLNLGYSSTDLFPDWRYAAELYHNFPDGWEASLGFRRLEFESSDVTIYTGTLAKYTGNWWISLRPNYVDKQDGSSRSAGLSARRYFGGRYEYLELTVRGGDSKSDDLTIPDPEERFDSFSFKAELRRRVSHQVVLKGFAGYRSEDLEIGGNRDSVTVGIGVEKHF